MIDSSKREIMDQAEKIGSGCIIHRFYKACIERRQHV